MLKLTIIAKLVISFLQIATYAVQNATWSNDEQTLKCHFLKGTTLKTCFVEIYHNQKLVHTQSTSDEYNLGNITSESGYYRLEVYDHEAQKG